MRAIKTSNGNVMRVTEYTLDFKLQFTDKDSCLSSKVAIQGFRNKPTVYQTGPNVLRHFSPDMRQLFILLSGKVTFYIMYIYNPFIVCLQFFRCIFASLSDKKCEDEGEVTRGFTDLKYRVTSCTIFVVVAYVQVVEFF